MSFLSKKCGLYRVGQSLVLFIAGLVTSILLIKRVAVSYHSLISTFYSPGCTGANRKQGLGAFVADRSARVWEKHSLSKNCSNCSSTLDSCLSGLLNHVE